MRRVVITAIGLAISAVALYLALSAFDLAAAVEVLSNADPLPLVSVVAVIAVQVLVRALRWSVLLPPARDGRRIRVLRLVPPLLVGYLGNVVLPARLGEPMRAVLVSRREQVGIPESLGSVLLERIVDTATLAVVVLVAAAVVDAPAWVVQVALLAALVGIAIVAILATVGVRPVVSAARGLPVLNRWARDGGPLDLLDRFATSLGGKERRGVIAVAAGISTLAWALDGTAFWLVGRSLGIDLAPAAAVLISGITVLGTAVPSAPGYVGTYELAASAVARALGVPGQEALALALLAHVLTVLPLAVGGGVSLLIVGADARGLLGAADHATEAPMARLG